MELTYTRQNDLQLTIYRFTIYNYQNIQNKENSEQNIF